jgi:hypothetical protein
MSERKVSQTIDEQDEDADLDDSVVLCPATKSPLSRVPLAHEPWCPTKTSRS